MSDQRVLMRVAALHAGMVGALAVTLAAAGLPVRGALLGGGAMALSFVLFWAIGRAVVAQGHRSAVAVLGAMKTLLYLGLVTAVLTGRLVVDGAGFGAGVACFLLATVAVALHRPRPSPAAR